MIFAQTGFFTYPFLMLCEENKIKRKCKYLYEIIFIFYEMVCTNIGMVLRKSVH